MGKYTKLPSLIFNTPNKTFECLNNGIKSSANHFACRFKPASNFSSKKSLPMNAHLNYTVSQKNPLCLQP